MRGTLSETSVADLCRALADDDATGALELHGPDGEGRIFFRQGGVYWASSPVPRARLGDRLVNAGLLDQEELDEALAGQRSAVAWSRLGGLLIERGSVTEEAVRVFVQEQILDALLEALAWTEGSYRFAPDEQAEAELPVDLPVDQVLLEVSRRQREWSHITAAIPDLDMVPAFDGDGSSTQASLEPDEFAVLASVDGRRSVRDLADALGYSLFEAARVVYGLVLLGVIAVHPPEQQDGAVAGPGPTIEPEPPESDLDVDVAAALEEALGGDRPAAAPAHEQDDAPPRVRVHVSDDLSDYLSGLDHEEIHREGAAFDEEPEPWIGGLGPESDEPEETAGDLAWLDELPDVPVEDGAETTAGDLLETAAAAEETEATTSGKAPEPAAEEPEPEPTADEPEPTADEPEPEPAAEEPTPAADEGPPAEEEEAGDVSELLRELSRLAIDEEEAPPATASPGSRPEKDKRPEGEAGTRDDARRSAREDAEERNKKRGIFGWGR